MRAGRVRQAAPLVDYVDVDAVVISHLHADHILDLVPFASGLRYAPRPPSGDGTAPTPARPRLFAPPGALEAFAGMSSATGMTADHIELAFDVTIYDPADALDDRRAGRALPARPALHPGQRGRVRRGEGARFTFSADCRPNQELCDFAAGTDLLLVEATLPRPEPRASAAPDAARGGRARRAGRARSALVLTHFSDELDVEWARAEGARGFGAPVDAAHEGATYELGA